MGVPGYAYVWWTHKIHQQALVGFTLRISSINLRKLAQGRNEGAKGERFTGRRITMGAPKHCGGAESPWRRRMAAEGAKKSQQCHKYFLQYSTFDS